MIHGAFSLACLNKSLTRDAPTPTNISTKSDPEIEKKGTSASPATALANNVLPVPGGPTRSTPLGILPPRAVYFLGFFRKSTTSITSSLASLRPATSANVTLTLESLLSNRVAFDFPILNICPPPGPPPPLTFFMMNNQIATKMNNGSNQLIIGANQLVLVSILYGTAYPDSLSSVIFSRKKAISPISN